MSQSQTNPALSVPHVPARSSVPLGARTRLGEVVGTVWTGERFYLVMNRKGDVTMIPAEQVEGSVNGSAQAR